MRNYIKNLVKTNSILLFIIIFWHISAFANQTENTCVKLHYLSPSRLNEFHHFKILNISFQSQNTDEIPTTDFTCTTDDIKSFFEHKYSNLSFSDINREYMFGPIYVVGQLIENDQLWHYSIDIAGDWGSWFQVDENGKVIKTVYFGQLPDLKKEGSIDK